MDILFVGDASNFHHALSVQLQRMGHRCVVVSAGSGWMDTERDIDLRRGAGLGGAVAYAARLLKLLPAMRGFDVVHIVNPVFLQLRPWLVRLVFDYLKSQNRSVFLSALGSDYDYVKACLDGDTFAYSEYMLGHTPTAYLQSPEGECERRHSWTADTMRRHQRHVLAGVDGAVACLYEYYKVCSQHLPPERLAYGGIPIDTQALQPHVITGEPPRVKLFIGIQRSRHIFKGTDRLLDAARELTQRYPTLCQLDVVENMPYAQYTERMAASHVLLDQLYSYTPATNALIAMAQGLVAVSGAEDEYYRFIGENRCRPIINVSPLVEGDIYRKLEWIVQNKALLPTLSRQSREFVCRHNDSAVVAQRHLDFWRTILSPAPNAPAND